MRKLLVDKKMTVFVLMVVYIMVSIVLQFVSLTEKNRMRLDGKASMLHKLGAKEAIFSEKEEVADLDAILKEKLEIKPNTTAFYLIGGWFLLAAGAGIVINIVLIILSLTKEATEAQKNKIKEDLRCFREKFPFDGWFLIKGVITCVFMEFLAGDVLVAFSLSKINIRVAQILIGTVGVNFFLFMLLFACVKDRKLSFFGLFGLEKRQFLKFCSYGVLGYFSFVPIMLFLTLVSLGICKFFGLQAKPHQIASYVVNEKSNVVLGYWFLVAVFFAPFFEEIFFRGVIYRVLLKRYSVLLSITVTSFIFSLLHFNYSQFLVIFFMGGMLNFLYYKTKSLVPSMVFHILNNTVSVSMLYFVLVMNK